MASGEIYLPLVVSFPDNPKVRALAQFGEDAGLARDLYVQMCLYCKRMLSDGFVPAFQMPLLVYPASPDRGNQFAKQLAFVGLITEEPDGWLITGYLDRNPTKAEVNRLTLAKSAGAQRANHRRWHEQEGVTDPDCRFCQRSDQTSDQTSDQRVESDRVSGVGDSESTKTKTKTETETETTASAGLVADQLALDANYGPAAGKQRRAKRIPKDFTVTPEMVAWARDRCPQVDGKRETEKFINHWTAKGGKDATKLDWVLTWRNWMLNAADRTPTASPAAANGTRPAARDKIASLQALKDPGNAPADFIQGEVL